MIKQNNLKSIFNKIFGSENQTFRGAHMADSFSSYVKGYDELKKASTDGLGLYVELEGIQHALYPPMKVPGHKPGYYSMSDDFFEIEVNDLKLNEKLSNHFLDKNYSEKIYGNAYDLGMFFEFLCRELLTTGNTYYAISWEKTKFDKDELILPKDFNYLHPATISIKGNVNSNFTIKQRYPLWSILADKFLDGVFNRNIKSEDALFLKYPFNNDSPVKQSLRFLPAIKKFYKFGLDQGEGTNNGKNHLLPVELARYTTYKEEKKKLDFAKIKIRREFNYLYDDQKLTTYYDVFTVVRYKKYLNDFRKFLLDEFNRQVMRQITIRNRLDVIPLIKIKNGIFVTNTELDKVFNEFKNKKISVNEFSNLIRDHLDKTEDK